jgi:hypothetical protein
LNEPKFHEDLEKIVVLKQFKLFYVVKPTKSYEALKGFRTNEAIDKKQFMVLLRR